jgi:hypothetical protein
VVIAYGGEPSTSKGRCQRSLEWSVISRIEPHWWSIWSALEDQPPIIQLGNKHGRWHGRAGPEVGISIGLLATFTVAVTPISSGLVHTSIALVLHVL